jgi:hypothetical protein
MQPRISCAPGQTKSGREDNGMSNFTPQAQQALILAKEQAERIRQELAVLKAKVETISSTVDEASHWPREPSPESFMSSLRRLSGPQPPKTSKVMTTALTYSLWFLAFAFLLRILLKRFRKP